MNKPFATLPEHILRVLKDEGISLAEFQPHLLGERSLMRAETTVSGRKWVLVGTYNGTKVVIKVADSPLGKAELRHERTCRTVLARIRFAYDVFFLPEELLYKERGSVLMAVHRFIEKEQAFISLPLEEQFTYALTSFKAQERAHAATYEHEQLVARTFGAMHARDYLKMFASFKNKILAPSSLEEEKEFLEKVESILTRGKERIEQYAGFLTHTDFVPHNFRINDGKLYLLDASSLRFGNKYEGWARFQNFMTLYNPDLRDALTTYVKENRAPEEFEALSLMRLYRLTELWAYYVGTLERSTGNVQKLNQARINYWKEVLATLREGNEIAEEVTTTYQALRDSLRSEDEKKRQENLH